MRRLIYILVLMVCAVGYSYAQEFNQIADDGTYAAPGSTGNRVQKDSTNHNQEIPRGLKVWTVDERFGDQIAATPDTLSHMFMNSVFTTGMRGEYNTLGNLGSPRINRIFVDRSLPSQFMFTQPYDFFITDVDKFHFTNTLSPVTNLTYNECGDKNYGEDHLKTQFAINAGKKLGVGFKFDYLYGRGYYQNQGSAHFNYTMYGSYLGDRYQAHLLMSTNHQKLSENGGITDDMFITHPETFEDNFRESEIPVVLQQNWNRNDNQHVFLSHRYSIGFNRKVPMTEDEIKAKKFAMESEKEKKAKQENQQDEQKFAGRPEGAKIAGNEPNDSIKNNNEGRISVVGEAAVDSLLAKTNKEEKHEEEWMKDEYVPVTSFIHTAKFDNYRRIYQAYNTHEHYYLNTFSTTQPYEGDTIFDKTRHYNLKNTLAIAMLEGFNKWAKAGIKVFATSDLRHFTLPDSVGGISSYNEHTLSIGGQLIKAEGNTLHYNATAELSLVGEDAGQLKIDGNADLNFRLFGDTVTLAAKGFFYRLNPTFYQRHYHAKHLWWDNSDLSNEIRTRIEGVFSYKKTRTTLRVAMDNIKDYTYFAQKYNITKDFKRTGNTVSVRQNSGNINLMTLQLGQNFKLGPLNWESQVTYQKSSNEDALPVPELNIYSNLYLNFKISKVLKVDLGADIRYFTAYYANDYSPLIGQFAVQDNGENNIKTGDYPIINVYANMQLKTARFFIMMSHANNGTGGNYFLTPHYPLNSSVLRFGVSWNFYN